ncbi:MAG: hemerythrin domain-containing protein [Caulobacteraceae bacterium]
MSSFPAVPSRRLLLGAGLALTAGVTLSGCGGAKTAEALPAPEFLMRGHGLLRRITSLFREAAPGVRVNPGALDMQALGQATDLFRAFGEEFQEKKLEEAIVFPAVQKAGGEAADLIPTLVEQHDRGRQLIAAIHGHSQKTLSPIDVEPLARSLEAMARMYDEHTAIEETLIFPAWRKTLKASGLNDASEQFAKINQAQFKGDGFEMALAEVKQIEQRMGLVHLRLFTASPPSSDAVAPVKSVGGNATE